MSNYKTLTQHAATLQQAIARLRSVEMGVYTAYSSFSGKSALIAPNGHIVQESEWGKSQSFNVLLPMLKNDTFFIKIGKFIYPLVLLIAFFLSSQSIKNKN